ncbi:flagellar biosynthesis protein FlhB [Phreatobacter oligotrophus]|uniref:Flagellar biosynthetic protein FlhB n=1 Tax=Phreatobacter oligotrophus TaxID=1122261 RepID=A0A2T4YZ95_9HYPH|nr:flagellar biosynthesis protein FlhB [Phreatobacter oligotrophus]PTM52272.1 flagellar biosynthetic protein FlhB [Phreatobacter oligotrophus]
MAEGDDDKDQKTHDPTQKKLDDALKKGDVAKSQDLVAWFLLFISTLVIATMGASSAGSLAVPMKNLLANADLLQVDRSALMQLLISIIIAIVVAVGLPMLALFLTGVGANLMQHRLVFSTESLKPKMSKISPLAGFKRIFGLDAIVNFAKGVAKISIVGTVIFVVLWPQRSSVDAMVRMDVEMLLPHTFALVMNVLMAVVAILAIIAIADYVYQYQRWYTRQKMSIQELKEEFKQSDGNPEIKAKIKQIRRERSRKRMMANVPNATVVVTNPTHFAVALKYEPGMAAPVCVAKGMDLVALKIREIATANDVPIVENVPLARALHASVEIDQPIEEEHYRAVAEVIGYVMRLKGTLR